MTAEDLKWHMTTTAKVHSGTYYGNLPTTRPEWKAAFGKFLREEMPQETIGPLDWRYGVTSKTASEATAAP